MKKQPVKLNLEYIAGFFDGEGCVYASHHDVRVIFTNTNLELLAAISEFFAEGKITQKKRTERDYANKPCYQLVMWNRRAERVLLLLLPHLILKRREAELALLIMSTFRKHGAPSGHSGNITLTEETVTLRKALAALLKEAKRCV